MSAQILANAAACQNTPAFRSMRAAGASDDKRPLDGAFGMIGAIINVARNAEIFGEEEEAEYLYQVISGCVRTCRVLNDGRRQVGAFYLPGDIIGIEAGREHAFSAEAIVSSTVRVLKRSIINSRASGDSTIARHLLDLSVTELQRTQAHALLLVKTALERVAGFLLEAALRAESRSEVQLPMSRQDIADYLGLTIETVSRTLSHLEHAKAIALPTPHRVILRNRAMLEELSAA